MGGISEHGGHWIVTNAVLARMGGGESESRRLCGLVRRRVDEEELKGFVR